VAKRRSSPPSSNTRSSQPSRDGNQLLAALPAAEINRIRPLLESVPLKLKEILHRPGEPIRHVYFPTSGFLSVLTGLEDGRLVEVATIGREGMVGVSAASEGTPSTAIAMVQAEADSFLRMPAAEFRDEMDRHGPFHDLITRYTHALLAFIMQSTACNAVHSVEQRLARWLLLAQDRVGKEEFPLTQEFVAMMLGATRPTVTVVAGTLQKAGLIKYQRGRLTIVDRKGLEDASCECYQTGTDILDAVTEPRRGSRAS
jgi:CRP-like cAMP-binding protein